MDKTIWIIANWKSNKTIAEALDWVGRVGPQIPRRDNIKVAVCPDFIALEEVKKAIQVGSYPLLLGSQDLSPFTEGPHTGEEAADQLKGLVDLSILGHSERRDNFEETNEMVAEKVKQALEASITPLVCVQGKDTPVPDGCKMIAYEPISAIGTGQPDTPADANEVATSFKEKFSQDLVILYGGSVKSDNCLQFVETKNISGLLIGGASLDPEEFVRIVDLCAHESRI